MKKNKELRPRKSSRPVPPMTQGKLEAVARRFHALSDPVRLRILYELGEGEHTVSELTALTGGTQSNISKHLGTLLLHGLVQRRRQGTSAYYSVADDSVYLLCDQVCGGIERTLDRSRESLG